MPKNPWTPKTEEEKAQEATAQAERDKAIKEAQKLASQCVNSKHFVKYKAKYEIVEKQTINELISYDDPEPIRYAFRVRIMLGKLHQLRLLLREVEADDRNKTRKK